MLVLNEMKKQLEMFAAYNAWANETLFQAVSSLTDGELRANKGAVFGSLLNTLNHILVVDCLWMYRFTGDGHPYADLREIIFQDFPLLWSARRTEDRRIIDFVAGLDDEQLNGSIEFETIVKPEKIIQRRSSALLHLFNHQTHHRGQCHATLTALGKPSLILDLVFFLRQEGRHWL